MIVALLILSSIHGLIWIILIGNLIYLRSRHTTENSRDLPSLSVMVPARNEVENIQRLLDTLEQQQYDNFEVIVYDDASTDGTGQLLESYTGPLDLIVLKGTGPPEGWLGKVHALHSASEHASKDLFLFLDADVELISTDALSVLAGRLVGSDQSAAITVLPRFRGGGLLLVSLIPHAILTGLPWPLVQRLRLRSLGALNGQAWLIHAYDYRRLRPHEHVKAEILEDVEIGRYLITSGITPTLVDATRLVAVHMYDSLADAWRGFRKNAYLLMGGRPIPFLLFLTLFAATNWLCILVSKYLLVSAIALKLVADRAGRIPVGTSVAAPASLVSASAIQLDSAVAHWRGRVKWKGRTLST